MRGCRSNDIVVLKGFFAVVLLLYSYSLFLRVKSFKSIVRFLNFFGFYPNWLAEILPVVVFKEKIKGKKSAVEFAGMIYRRKTAVSRVYFLWSQ